ncbi:MAG: cation transporter [Deltaproteobacteria bacterium]|nr:cation transporter [Deltaproteobacteria bacterium]
MTAGHDHDHDHDHDHGGTFARSRLTERRRLLITLLVTATILVAELVGGVVSGSLALLSDAGHMATDAGALLLALVACALAARPADSRRTYGFHRLEVLSALVNGALLFVVAAYLLYEAWLRLRTPVPIRTGLMLGVAVVGLLGNLVGVWLLHGLRSLNVRGAYLHLLTDTLSSVAVIAGAAVMAVAKGAWIIDPILGGLIGLAVLWGAFTLVRDAVHVLLEGTPTHIDLDRLTADLERLEGVKEVHDLHVWTIASGLHALSAHVVVPGHTLRDGGGSDAVLRRIKEFLLARHAIAHTTVQIESEDYVHVGEVH